MVVLLAACCCLLPAIVCYWLLLPLLHTPTPSVHPPTPFFRQVLPWSLSAFALGLSPTDAHAIKRACVIMGSLFAIVSVLAVVVLVPALSSTVGSAQSRGDAHTLTNKYTSLPLPPLALPFLALPCQAEAQTRGVLYTEVAADYTEVAACLVCSSPACYARPVRPQLAAFLGYCLPSPVCCLLLAASLAYSICML